VEVGGNVELRRVTVTMMMMTLMDYVCNHCDCWSQCDHCCQPTLSSSTMCYRTDRSRRRSHEMPTSDRTPPTPGTYRHADTDIQTIHDISVPPFQNVFDTARYKLGRRHGHNIQQD